MAKILPFDEKQIDNLALILPSCALGDTRPPDVETEAMMGVEEIGPVPGQLLEDASGIIDEKEAPQKDKEKQKNQTEQEVIDFQTLVELPAVQELRPPKYKKKERKFNLEFEKQEKPQNIVEQWLQEEESFSFTNFLSIQDCVSGFFSQFNGDITQFKQLSFQVSYKN